MSIWPRLRTGERRRESGDVDCKGPPGEEARRLELVEPDDVVESCTNSTMFHVCKVASGANDTRRFARRDELLEPVKRVVSTYQATSALPLAVPKLLSFVCLAVLSPDDFLFPFFPDYSMPQCHHLLLSRPRWLN